MTLIPTLVAPESLAQRIILILWQKAMVNADLADLYGIPTKALNQAIRRSIEHFSSDFMFRPNAKKEQNVVINCDHFAELKLSSSLPHALSEHGTLTLGNELKSSRTVEIGLLVVRTFIQIRELLSKHKEFATKFDALAHKIPCHDQVIASLIDAIRHLMQAPAISLCPIVFTADISKLQSK